MRFRRYPSGDIELSDVRSPFTELLAEIPLVAARHEGAWARLYPDPVDPESDAAREVVQDWQELVRPGLEHLFASNRDIVSGDLAGMESPGESAQCVIPRAHFDAWLNTLNQARLVMVEENRFSERELSGQDPVDTGTRRGLLLFMVNFYGELQQLLVEASG